jgi:hypothetical protein
MMFSSKTCRFALVLAAACNAFTSASNDKEDPVNLFSAANYVILTKAGISTVPSSTITGDIAVSPIAAGAMTGFSLAIDPAGEFSTSLQVVGKAFAANYAAPIPTHLTSAVGAMETAYTNAAGRLNANATRINVGGGLLGGVYGGANDPLTPGVYTFGSGVTIGSDIYFEGTGEGEGQGETDVFIIQLTGDLLQAADTNVFLTNGALAKNIFWQLAGHVEVGVGAHMEGIILSKTAVLFGTGSSLNGRILAQTACTLQMATITQP